MLQRNLSFTVRYGILACMATLAVLLFSLIFLSSRLSPPSLPPSSSASSEEQRERQRRKQPYRYQVVAAMLISQFKYRA